MTESSFVDHINDIVDNTKIRRTNPKKFKIRSDKLRLYAPLNESTGVATDIVFDDLDTNMTWSMEYSDEFTKNFNGLFLKINRERKLCDRQWNTYNNTHWPFAIKF
jgi:hypothetical protein